MKKTKVYMWIKVAGILSFIPMVLASGPLAGYFAGAFIEKKFDHAPYPTIFCIAIGIAASAKETIRIIKIALKSEGSGK